MLLRVLHLALVALVMVTEAIEKLVATASSTEVKNLPGGRTLRRISETITTESWKEALMSRLANLLSFCTGILTALVMNS